jgi:hypothetical protein
MRGVDVDAAAPGRKAIGKKQEGLRALDPASRQVGAGRFAIGCRERAGKVKTGVARFAGHRVEVERLRVLAIDEVASSPQGRQEE